MVLNQEARRSEQVQRCIVDLAAVRPDVHVIDQRRTP